jgi:hypothetical protein
MEDARHRRAVAQNARVGAPHYKTPANFRIDLTCTK